MTGERALAGDGRSSARVPVEGVVTASNLAPLAGATAGGVLYFLGYIGYGAWPCLLVFLVPLWWALERVRVAAPLGVAPHRAGPSASQPTRAGFSGCGAWSIPSSTASRSSAPFSGSPTAPGSRLGFACYALLYGRARRQGWPIALAGIPSLIVVEWLQPQMFPLYAGAALVNAPVLMQSADLGGPLLLTALLAGANVVIWETWTWRRARRRKPLAIWMAALVIGAAVLGYGGWRMRVLDAAARAAPALRVGLVQANLGPREKSELGVVTHRQHLQQTRELLAAGDLDLAIWPETAYIRGLRRPLPISGRPILAELSVPLLFGGSSVHEENGRRVKSNSAFLIGADGTIRDVYDKNLLIPLAEYLPLAEIVPGLAGWLPHVDDFHAATDTPALHLGPWRIATPICYEVIRPEFVRRMVEQGRPHLLVTLANDAWFGRSHEPWLHLALAQLRAVEHRRFLVRATNSGVSAIVDPSGRVVTRTGLLTRENLRAVVHPLDGRTVYARLGDWPGWLSAAIVVLTLVARRDRL